MADPLSIASGIAGLVTLTATILSTGYRVYSQTKQHSENINNLLNEVACFSGILVGLQAHIGEQQPSPRGARTGDSRFFSTQPCRTATEECKGILEKIQKLLEKLGKTKAVIRPIRWQFEQDESKELVNHLERYKTTFILWFQIENGSKSEELNNLERTIIAQLDAIRCDQEKAQQQAKLERTSGSGKTVLVSTVINQIQEFYEIDAEVGICYYYCDFARDQLLTPAKLVGSLLAQLLRVETVWGMTESKILTLFNEHKNKSSYPTLQQLEGLLLEVAKVLTTTIVIIDALDEVPNRAGIIEFLLRLIGSEGDVKLFVASRNEPDLKDAFEEFGGITIRSGDVEADVERYVRSRISQSRWKNSEESDNVINTLTQKADGMFLWVHCQLDELCKVRTKVGLESIRGLPRGLESTYQGILAKVDSMDQELARRILQFVMFSNRPLDLSELVDAIAVEDGSTCLKDLEKLKLHQPEDVFEICGSLIRYSESTRTLRLAHHSVREFLATPVLEYGVLNEFYMLEDDCCFHLAKTCLTYLNLNDFGSRKFRIYEEGEEHSFGKDAVHDDVIPDHPFLDYAATHWWSHVARINPEEEFCLQHEQINPGALDKLWPDIQRLLDFNRENFLYWTSVLRYAHGEHEYPLSITPIHICALHNLTEIAQRLLSDGHSCNAVTQDQRTALHIALQNGNIEMVQLIIDYKPPNNLYTTASLEQATIDGRRPLHLAIESGNGKAVKLLVEAGANVTAPLPNGDFPLSIAVENGWNELVPILLNRADLNSCLADGRSMLHLAAELGHESIAKEILGYKIDPNKKDNNGWAPIHFSAHHGHKELIDLLLQHNANATLCDINGWTPLHAAIHQRHLACASLLLQKGSSKSVVSPGTRLAHRPSAGRPSSNVRSARQLGQTLGTLPDSSHRRLSSALLNTPAGGTPSNDRPLVVDGRYSLQPHVHQRSAFSSSTGLSSSSRDTYSGDGRRPPLRVNGKYALNRQSRTTVPASVLRLSSSASPTANTLSMPTPLFIAVSNDFREGVELILNFSPDLSDMPECIDSGLSLPDLSILELLLEKASKADTYEILRKVEKGCSPQAHLLCLRADHRRHLGLNPILAAITGRHHEVLKLALQDKLPQETSCLHEGFKKVVMSSRFEDAILLAEYGGAKEIDLVSKMNGMTLLHEAVKVKNDKAVEFLMKKGANLSIRDQSGSTAVHLAVKHDCLALLSLLFSNSSPIDLAGLDNMGRTALHIAAERGYHSLVKFMIIYDNNVLRALDKMKRTALHVAAEKGRYQVAELLLERGAEIEARDNEGETALHKVSASGSLGTARMLLKNGAQVRTEDNHGKTALDRVIEYKDQALIRLFLENGFDIVVPDDYYVDPGVWKTVLLGKKNPTRGSVLHQAACNADKAAIRILLQHGADIMSKDMDFGATALHFSIYNGDESVIRILLDNNTDKEARDKNGETALHWSARNGRKAAVRLLLDHGSNYDVEDIAGKTALHWAAWNGEEEIVRMLLEVGSGIEAKDNEAETPLHWAAWIGHSAAVRLLLGEGANPSLQDRSGKTALHRAVEGRHNGAVQLILERKSDVNVQDKDGRTALHWAAWNGDQAIVQQLLFRKQTDIAARDTDGRSALYRAAERGHKSIVELLINKGADAEAKDNYGETALHRAARDGNKAMVTLLLETESDIEAKTTGAWLSGETSVSGETPLHWAAWNGHLGVVFLLLNKGADYNVMDISGNTPLDRAVQASHEAVIELLQAQALSVSSS